MVPREDATVTALGDSTVDAQHTRLGNRRCGTSRRGVRRENASRTADSITQGNAGRRCRWGAARCPLSTYRLKRLDGYALADSRRPVVGSDAEKRWRHDLYKVRHLVVDSGYRGLTREEARAAVSTGINATVEIEL